MICDDCWNFATFSKTILDNRSGKNNCFMKMNKEIEEKLILDTKNLQNNDCCKFWIEAWFRKIHKTIKNMNGGGRFLHCPDCCTEFISKGDF